MLCMESLIRAALCMHVCQHNETSNESCLTCMSYNPGYSKVSWEFEDDTHLQHEFGTCDPCLPLTLHVLSVLRMHTRYSHSLVSLS